MHEQTSDDDINTQIIKSVARSKAKLYWDSELLKLYMVQGFMIYDMKL